MSESDPNEYVAGQYKPWKRDFSKEARFIEQGLAGGKFQANRSATIHFSRKIGSGALEIAHLLAPRIGYTVIDRGIMEHIAKNAQLRLQTAAYFDERYPGRLATLAAMFSQKKKIVWDDYVGYLFSAVLTLADLRPTIFVGRGVHLIMPRNWVFSVRIIASQNKRVQRLMRKLNLKERDARQTLKKMDKEQHRFFQRAFGKREAKPAEFDMVINCDHMTDPAWAAKIIQKAFQKKFAGRPQK
jgi:cytidylate kinase